MIRSILFKLTCLASVTTLFSMPSWASTPYCSALTPVSAIRGSLESVNDEWVEISDFSQGIQAVFLSNRSTATATETMSRRLAQEFSQYSYFRQVIVVDGTKWVTFKEFVTRLVKSYLPHTSGSPYIGFDFEGSLVDRLETIAEQALPDVNSDQTPVLFIVDGDGQVASVFNIETGNLPARQCMREQIEKLQTQASSSL